MPAFGLEKIAKFVMELMFFDISFRITGRIETEQFKSVFQAEGDGRIVAALTLENETSHASTDCVVSCCIHQFLSYFHLPVLLPDQNIPDAKRVVPLSFEENQPQFLAVLEGSIR